MNSHRNLIKGIGKAKPYIIIQRALQVTNAEPRMGDGWVSGFLRIPGLQVLGTGEPTTLGMTVLVQAGAEPQRVHLQAASE